MFRGGGLSKAVKHLAAAAVAAKPFAVTSTTRTRTTTMGSRCENVNWFEEKKKISPNFCPLLFRFLLFHFGTFAKKKRKSFNEHFLCFVKQKVGGGGTETRSQF